uniref:AsIV-cont00003-ORF1 n=1 Tax=Apophua simplicipes ichnovirus TaxID=1329648 RepID=S5DR15_9VIRU|nr:AsIV-cont00003-ORF1 [Apophua simplicipes ichnovirus]
MTLLFMGSYINGFSRDFIFSWSQLLFGESKMETTNLPHLMEDERNLQSELSNAQWEMNICKHNGPICHCERKVSQLQDQLHAVQAQIQAEKARMNGKVEPITFITVLIFFRVQNYAIVI